MCSITATNENAATSLIMAFPILETHEELGKREGKLWICGGAWSNFDEYLVPESKVNGIPTAQETESNLGSKWMQGRPSNIPQVPK